MKDKATVALLTFLLGFCLIAVDAHSQTGSGMWTTASSDGFTPRASFTSSAVNGKIYVIGGVGGGKFVNTVQVFDPSTNTWSTPATTGTFTPRYRHTSSVVNSKIYVMGGDTSLADDKHLVNTLKVFDPSTNSWSTPKTKGTSTARFVHSSFVVNGKIYVIGGWDGHIDINTLEVFDPSTNTWSTPKTGGTFLPSGAYASGVVNDKIYILGGVMSTDSTFELRNIVQIFDPLKNSWSTPMTKGTITPPIASCANVVGGKIYVMGGQDTNGSINTVNFFDPSTNAWSVAKSTGTFTSRNLLASSVVHDKIYVLGGTANKKALSTNEVFTPAHKKS